MSIINQVVVARREFPGYPDPSLPIGIWQGTGQVIGDASGGNMEVDLVFNRSTAERDGNFYSFDQLMINSTDVGGTRVGELFFFNLGTVVGLIFQRYAIQMLISHPGNFANIRTEGLAFLPLFMGRQFREGVTTGLAIAFANINTAIVDMSAMGYVWGPRSINSPGGPSRPLQGIFSA